MTAIRWVFAGSAAAVVAISACGTSGKTDCDRSTMPGCWNCCTDQSFAAECNDGEWSCPSGTPDLSDCHCPPPPASSMRPCIDPDSGVCLNSCGLNERCVAIQPCRSADGGWDVCVDADGGAVYEAYCHLPCNFFEQCSPTESCRRTVITSCRRPTTEMLCCATGTCPD